MYTYGPTLSLHDALPIVQRCQGASERRLGGAVDLGQRGVHRLYQLLAVHEAITLLRKFRLLAAARVEGVQLLHRMAQEQLVALRLGEPPGRYLARLQRILPGPPQRAQEIGSASCRERVCQYV